MTIKMQNVENVGFVMAVTPTNRRAARHMRESNPAVTGAVVISLILFLEDRLCEANSFLGTDQFAPVIVLVGTP
jgi:hypothetical protein